MSSAHKRKNKKRKKKQGDSLKLFNASTKPYIRWWFLEGPFEPNDIRQQLDWFRECNFGGVEVQYMYLGSGRDRKGRPPARAHIPEWNSKEFTQLMLMVKKYASSIGLGCDFTFGSCWPFGGDVVSEEHAARTISGEISHQLVRQAWHAPGDVVNHLSEAALRAYAEALTPTFGLLARDCALFCDSLEIEKHNVWTPELTKVFQEENDYTLSAEEVATDPCVRYDYRRIVAKAIVSNFYAPFTRICNELGAYSRVQCHGAPADLLEAYGTADVPESETLLFLPKHSFFASSGAALNMPRRNIVSCETFTCIYGFPGPGSLDVMLQMGHESVADLKMLADSVIACGVNQIVWHGAPYGESRFYALVQVSPHDDLTPHLPAFNSYLEKCCFHMQRGKPYSKVAVYAPNEDMMMRGMLPAAQRTPGSCDYWEMRYVCFDETLCGFAPLWISAHFLKMAHVDDERCLCVNEMRFELLYVDVEYMDVCALQEVLRLVKSGLRVVLTLKPKKPGKRMADSYEQLVDELVSLENVKSALCEFEEVKPVVSCVDEHDSLPPMFVREIQHEELLLFFAHPWCASIRYPMKNGGSSESKPVQMSVVVERNGKECTIDLQFGQFSSLMYTVDRDGNTENIDVCYEPPIPEMQTFSFQ